METQILKIDKDNIDEESMKRAAKLIEEGKIVAFPTETVYGLGANGLDEEAIMKLFIAKGRPQDNPLILHIHSIDQLKTLVESIPDVAYKCIDKFWPGPLTILFKKSELVPSSVTAGLDTVAIRMPKNSIALELIRLSDKPIAGPSANLSGKPSPTCAEHVIEDLYSKVDMIIDGGECIVGLESTVLDLSGDTPMVLRPGFITLEDLKEIIPNISQDLATIKESDRIVPKSPGQKYRHYAPKADMMVFTGEIEAIVSNIKNSAAENISKGLKVGIMATDETIDMYDNEVLISVGSRVSQESIARNLFKIIRLIDEKGVDIILAEGVPTKFIGRAIMNRMMKASGGKIIEVK